MQRLVFVMGRPLKWTKWTRCCETVTAPWQGLHCYIVNLLDIIDTNLTTQLPLNQTYFASILHVNYYCSGDASVLPP